MKTYTMSFAAATKHKPEYPERTARRSFSWDVTFQIWPSRASMAKSIRMQQKRAYRNGDWSACVPLTDGEGW